MEKGSAGSALPEFSTTSFEGFEKPKQRIQIDASFAVDAGTLSHKQRQLGFEVALRDGSQAIFLEEQAFIFVQRAPYDRWDHFSNRALTLLGPAIKALGIDEFSRVGLRFVNRIDIPGTVNNTDDYVTVSFDGPRIDRGIIDEFQLRVVKPTEKEGIRYALVLATTPSPLPDHTAILLDVDVFSQVPVSVHGEKLIALLAEMRTEKNDIFKACLTDRARILFGGMEE